MLSYIIKKLFVLYFHLKGWKLKGKIPKEVKKGVLIFAPHTSNEDFIHTIACAEILKVKLRFLGKAELFKFPVKKLLLDMGGLPVNRKNSHNLVDYMISLLNGAEELIIAIPAEGTRKLTKTWKTGFYHVAKGANVPVLLAYLDYENKLAGVGEVFYTTDDTNADFKYIENFYADAKAKYPELFSNKIQVKE